jgi:bifunctional non-homologous end joining protein LigD
MALEEYARKRTFEKTPEPPPGAVAGGGNRYCIQRHLARRLHYDLRLEVGGTLKSWAVPQGPSLDPGDKRLAVMVEDHPLEYGTFEGNIPKGNYGAGSVMLWDEGTFEVLGPPGAEEQLERGDFKIRIHGHKIEGDFALIRMKSRGKGNEWLLIKKKDAAARPGYDIEQHAWSVSTGRTQDEIAANIAPRERVSTAPVEADPSKTKGAIRAPIPAQIPVMLAYSDNAPPVGKGWLYEIKWDGVRALWIRDEDGQTKLLSRKNTPISRQYPELSVLHNYIQAESAVIDGEIAAVDDKGRPSFERIQPRIMASDPNAIAQMARSRPVVYFAFDLLYLNGYDLRGAALIERKRLLEQILKENTVLRYSQHYAGSGKELLEAARAQGLEGILAKHANSCYYGARSKEWLKIKITREQDFVLCGWTEGERDFFGALILGVYDDGKLHWAGNVGTGFDRRLMEAIFKQLEPLGTKTSPFGHPIPVSQKVHWAKPELVCTVKYLEWTSEGRLRAPVFVGMRTDADPRECVRHPEKPPARTPLLTGDKEEVRVSIEGRTVKFTHLNKVLYPDEGYTKRDVANYYDAVADLLIPHWRDRPLSLRRYVEGIGKEGFFQKNAASGFPDWMRKESILAEDGDMREQVIGGGKAELLYLVNLGCIDQNPWMSRVRTLDNPDFVLIDLDPSGCGFDKIVEAAQVVRAKLEMLEIRSYPKTTGGDGMHLYIPLDPVYSYEMSKAFAEIVARIVASERPDLFTVPRSVSRREKGKVYFDYLQNGRGKTISAPYVLRAYPGAPVATPLEWREVARGLEPRQFHIRNAVERFDRVGDLFAGVLTDRQRLEPALGKLEAIVRNGSAGGG